MAEGAELLPVAVDVVLLTLGRAPPGTAPAEVEAEVEAEADAGTDHGERPLLALVVRRAEEPHAGRWALPGTRLGREDDLEEAAAGLLGAIGLAPARHLEQLATFAGPDRDPRGRILSISHLALVPAPTLPGPLADGSTTEPRPRVQEVAWVAALDPPPLAFDHGLILDAAVRRLRGKLTYSTVAYGLLPDTFTLSELQAVYESVLGQRLDKRNFRKKVLALGMVEATGEQRRGPHRPARLHRFRRRGLVELGDVIAP